MKITVICDAFRSQSDFAVSTEELIRGLEERGHEVVTVCLDETERDREGTMIIPGLRAVENSELENAVWDSDVVYLTAPTVLGRAALRLCREHRIPVAAAFCLSEGNISFRRYSGRSLHSDMMALRHFYDGYLQYVDALLYPSKAAQEAFEHAADCETKGFAPDDDSPEKVLDCIEDMLNAVHV